MSVVDTARLASLDPDLLSAPFPWPGGKSRAAALIWERFGDVVNYVEPFAGSLAVLLGRPLPFTGSETANDINGYIANAWRAIAADPQAVAYHADWPVNEIDCTARHAWLVGQREDLVERLMGDPDFFDAKIAGRWLHGISSWIGSGYCSGNGPWQSTDGRLVDTRQLPHLSGTQGVTRKLPNIGNNGKGTESPAAPQLYAWMEALAARLRQVRVTCGDWRRVLGKSPTFGLGLTAVLLDPPYEGFEGLYEGASDVASDVRTWAISAGKNPLMRIALCGYDEHDGAMPTGWTKATWKAGGGYGNQRKDGSNENRHKETIWFSPHCIPPRQRGLFDDAFEVAE